MAEQETHSVHVPLTDSPPETNGELAAFQENMRLMSTIVREMKEIAELPSEKPKDVSPLQKVEISDHGGVFTYMEGYEHPYKGFPFHEFVDRIDLMKKITRTTLSGIYHELKKSNKLWLLTLLPSLWIVKTLVRAGIYVFYRIVERFRLKSRCYCQAVRELYRAFSIEDPNETVGDRDLRFRIRDCLCMILEFDNAYRYRTQDIIVELDQKRIKTHTIAELHRLFDIMSTREKTQEIRDTWKLFKYLVSFYLRFDKKVRNIIGDVLSEIDIEKVKLDAGDIEFCKKRQDYTFKFMQNNVS